MQEIYSQPVEPKLIAQRIEEIKSRGVGAAGEGYCLMSLPVRHHP